MVQRQAITLVACFFSMKMLACFSPEAGGTTMWDLSTGRLVTQHYGAETREWGLGAIFDPSVVGNRQSPDGVASMIAQPDTYSTTATITAATVP